ncbi:TRAM domain-containing protein [Parachlamydia sp. AcF125]|uniref:PIN/TRAM domain-containing protein n=1 Tax=Parachlamydia sp. AcF125 TaxID=2795736 RepID=UPI001BC98C08|nr:TRAM domain-containing protein [Parachlamydia sp. AcF125]MBS4168888.1 putative PIN and TRAM-domain containing protein YacL [Parachlamydia sp. AcF125]
MMSISLVCIRAFFVAFAVLIALAYVTIYPLSFSPFLNLSMGILGGLVASFIIVGLESTWKRFGIIEFALTLAGIVLGNFMGEALWTILQPLSFYSPSAEIASLFKASVFLISIYFSLSALFHTAYKLQLQSYWKKKEASTSYTSNILIDSSALMDPRIIDLAASGILDNHLIIPSFVTKELQQFADQIDEQSKAKGRAALDIIKKLEALPHLELRHSDIDFTDLGGDTRAKLNRLATVLPAKILTADMSRTPQSSDEISIINIHFLSNALKPMTQTGECLTIKIQRYGKEPRQGVGYLKDGTMVVVNGGAEFIGEEIKAYVLSVKHTASGRMIFCNASDDELTPDLPEQEAADLKVKNKNYYTI